MEKTYSLNGLTWSQVSKIKESVNYVLYEEEKRVKELSKKAEIENNMYYADLYKITEEDAIKNGYENRLEYIYEMLKQSEDRRDSDSKLMFNLVSSQQNRISEYKIIIEKIDAIER